METGGWWAPTTLARFSCLFRSFTPRKLKWPHPLPLLVLYSKASTSDVFDGEK